MRRCESADCPLERSVIYAGRDTRGRYRVMAPLRSKPAAARAPRGCLARKEFVKNSSDGRGVEGLDAHLDFDHLCAAAER